MTSSREAVQAWARENHPKALEPGTVENAVARDSHRVALDLGFQEGDPNYLAHVGSDLAKVRPSGVILTPEMEQNAKDLGCDPDEYAAGVQRLEFEKAQGWRQ